MNGRSQAVRLPSNCRFDGSSVYVRRDAVTGDVVLSKRPEGWGDFFEQLTSVVVPADFLANRDGSPPQQRDVL
jgi:antitoxin VapB